MATKKCEEFKLNACKDGDYERSFRSLERKGFINVEGKGQMRILRVKGDGNCQFRSVAVLIAGDDDEENHKTVRKVALQAFETYDDAKLIRSGFFSHHHYDCPTRRSCAKKGRDHSGGILQASKAPHRRLVNSKEEFSKEM